VSPINTVKVLLNVSPPTETLPTTFVRLGMSTEEPDIVSGAEIPAAKTTHIRAKKRVGVFTDGKYGQQVDLDINYKASQYVGHKCEMILFDPNALPPTLLEGVRPLINRRNVINSFDYEADLLIFEGCWRQSQTSDFQAYLEAPPTANPPSKVMVKRRAMAVLFDLFGDPPQEWLNESEVDLSSYRNVARFLFHLRKTRPRLVLRKLYRQVQS
jgi:hypothetical protein